MKHKEIHKSIEVKTFPERILKRELDCIIEDLHNSDRYNGNHESDKLIRQIAEMKAKEVEDALHLLLTHRKYLENPEEYKLT